MFELVDTAMYVMFNNLQKNYNDVTLAEADKCEHRINDFRNQLREEHFENIRLKKYKYEAGMFFTDIFSQLEKTGDFIINITEAICDENAKATVEGAT